MEDVLLLEIGGLPSDIYLGYVVRRCASSLESQPERQATDKQLVRTSDQFHLSLFDKWSSRCINVKDSRGNAKVVRD